MPAFLVFISFIFQANNGAIAQASLISNDRFQGYYEAKQWFAAGNYFLAYPVFKELERSLQNDEASRRQVQMDELNFYSIACELMQDNIAAERNAKAYLEGNNSATFKGQLGYYLGKYYFRKEQYEQAVEAFEKASIENLGNNQVAEMQFAQGYSLFTQKKFTQAKPLLNSVRQVKDGPNYTDANYYYGLLAFNDRNYRDAINSFDIAQENPKYQPLVPYYSASIQYALGQKDKGLDLAEKALAQGNQYYATELSQLVGHAYFEKGEYAKALPYLEKYVAATPKVKREDLYELAYAYYTQKNWNKAIEGFKPLSGGQDSLSQHAMYMLGDAYLKTNQKANAKTAFRFCADNSTNPVLKENAMFHAGKLAYELGLDDEATNILKEFTSKYTASNYNAEAKDLLVNALANTSNYREALTLYESITNRSVTTQRLLPRLLYNRAQEEINDRKLAEANILINRGLAAPYNDEVKPLLQFWKGELLYQQKDYGGAAQYMSDYLRNPNTQGEANPTNARYTLAYSYMMTGQYGAAQREWESLAKSTFVNSQQQEDIQVRLADAYYMQKTFGRAQPIYNGLVDRRSSFADHALYQLGMIAGAENKPTQKITFLQSVDRQYPNSLLTPMANLEIAKTYLSDEKYREALPALSKIIAGKGGENLKPEAYLKQGLAYYNLGNNTEALASFRTLVNKYGNSPEAEEAIDNVRSIYVEQGKPNEFISFLQSVGRKVDTNVADSLNYTSAELQLSEGKKDLALASFADYLKRFPDGRYVVAASWNVAELYREKKDLKNAVTYYEAVAFKAPNRYAEPAMLQAARLHYFEWKDYKKAAGYYQQLKLAATTQENKLEAMRGLVRCQYYSGDYADAVTNANELLEQRGIGSDDKIFANLVLGKNAQQSGNCSAASKYYESVANLSKAEYGAEARYQIAACLYQQNKLEDAEKAAFDAIKKSGSYTEWVTKSYLLLGDIFYKQKDYFNAKATYKSIAENSTIKELKDEAITKLAQVEKDEREQSKIGG